MAKEAGILPVSASSSSPSSSLGSPGAVLLGSDFRARFAPLIAELLAHEGEPRHKRQLAGVSPAASLRSPRGAGRLQRVRFAPTCPALGSIAIAIG